MAPESTAVRNLSPAEQGIPWRAVRLIKGSRMVELDVYWFHWIATCVYPVQLIEENMHLSVVSQQLWIARSVLASFDQDAARLFPNTSSRAMEMVELINRMIPVVPSFGPDRIVTPVEIRMLRDAANRLDSTLKDEAKHNYVLCLENQRCLSAYSLVEKIEDCFSMKAWNAIEDSAKKEFEESGRCLALERYTAAGFHALRGVECVIRQYIVKLTGELPRKRDWGTYTELLKTNGADPALIAVLDNMRTLDRNPLMHPEDWLSVDDAIGIFMIAQTAVVRLVTGLAK